MSTPRVLIVEDEPMVAMDLESIVLGVIAADVVVVASVSGARQAMAAPLDFALLDIEVTDGKTFEIARELQRNGARIRFRLGRSARSASSRPPRRPVHFQAVRPTSDRAVLREQSAVEGFPIESNRNVIPTRPRNPETVGRRQLLVASPRIGLEEAAQPVVTRSLATDQPYCQTFRFPVA